MSDSATKSTALAIIPRSVSEARDLAGMYAKSSLLPAALKGKEADVFVTIMSGLELGLSPMAALRSIHVIQGKPILSADGMVAVVQASGLCEYFIQTESSAQVATYETKRKGAPTPQRLSFTIDEAKLAGLAGGDNWKKYPAAMLRARAKAALARDVYPDAIAGVYTDDEARDFSAVEPTRRLPMGAPYQTSHVINAVIDAEVVDDEPALSLAERIRACSSLDELGVVRADVLKLKSGSEERAAAKVAYDARRDEIMSAMRGDEVAS